MVCGSRAIGRWLGHKDRALRMGSVPLLNTPQRASSPLLQWEAMARWWPSLDQETRSYKSPSLPVPWSWDSSLQKMRNGFLCMNPQVHSIHYSSTKEKIWGQKFSRHHGRSPIGPDVAVEMYYSSDLRTRSMKTKTLLVRHTSFSKNAKHVTQSKNTPWVSRQFRLLPSPLFYLLFNNYLTTPHHSNTDPLGRSTGTLSHDDTQRGIQYRVRWAQRSSWRTRLGNGWLTHFQVPGSLIVGTRWSISIQRLKGKNVESRCTAGSWTESQTIHVSPILRGQKNKNERKSCLIGSKGSLMRLWCRGPPQWGLWFGPHDPSTEQHLISRKASTRQRQEDAAPSPLALMLTKALDPPSRWVNAGSQSGCMRANLLGQLRGTRTGRCSRRNTRLNPCAELATGNEMGKKPTSGAGPLGDGDGPVLCKTRCAGITKVKQEATPL